MYYRQYLQIENNTLITTVKIPIDSPVIEMFGNVILEKDIPAVDLPNYWQIGPNSFLAPSGGFEDVLQHNCEPNCGLHVVGNRAILMSLYNLPAGTELTVDYATTSTDTINSWQMKCDCGSNKCRHIISGNSYLDSTTKQMYIDKNVLPMYIQYPKMFYKIY